MDKLTKKELLSLLECYDAYIQEAKSFNQLIYQVECYGRRDLIALSGIMNELNIRGISSHSEIVFD